MNRLLWTAPLLAAILFSPLQALAQAEFPSRADLRFDRFYNYEEMGAALKKLADAYPELLSLQSIGKSGQGREMWLVTANHPKTGPARAKAALYIDGNIHGNEIQAGEVALYTLWYLTKSYGRIPAITDLLDHYAFYVLPMVNPDGRAYWFSHPNTPHSSRFNQQPVDDDHDGIADEDPPDDLDGDGNICEMRIQDPNGRFRVSKRDPRLMEFVPPGESGGEYTLLGSEGIDNDGDGRINEDGPGGYDMNRNWPAEWQPNAVQFGSGDYPLSFPETRSIASFILDHPNIAAVQGYHNAGGMILRGPGARYIPEYPPDDLQVYDQLGRTGEQILPGYRYMILWRDLYTVHGGFITWTYEGLGIFSFTNELFVRSQYFSNASGDQRAWMADELDLLRFNDLLAFGQNFVEWHEVDHPQYGKVEVGGFSKYSSRVPPPFMLEELCHRNMAFTLYHAKQMPRLEFARREVKPLGGGVFEVTVELKNTRLIPTIAAIAQRRRIGARDSISIQAAGGGPGIEVLAGGALEDRLNNRFRAAERQPWRLWIDGGIPGESARSFRWYVRASGREGQPGAALIRYRSDKGGTHELKLPLEKGPARKF